MTRAFIPISAVAIGTEEEHLVLEVLRSGHLAQGPVVERLEAQFAEASGADHAVAVSSGTTALVAALTAAGVGRGDEVITAPLTFAATLNAILEVGATARFADIGDDYCVDPASVEALCNDRTRAIVPVHLYGQPADMTRLVALARSRGLAIVEDAAQAIGATVGERPVGSFGIGCFSLYATKNITTGEGGIVTTDDDETAAELRLLRNQGMRARYDYVRAGHNWRLTDLQAAVGVPQMARLPEIIAARRHNADRLDAGLRGLPIGLPSRAAGRTHVFHQYTVTVGPESGTDRDRLAAHLADLGVGSGIYYPRLVHDYDCYRGRPDVVADPTPRAGAVATQVLSLPVHPGVGTAEVDRVIDAIRHGLGE